MKVKKIKIIQKIDEFPMINADFKKELAHYNVSLLMYQRNF